MGRAICKGPCQRHIVAADSLVHVNITYVAWNGPPG